LLVSSEARQDARRRTRAQPRRPSHASAASRMVENAIDQQLNGQTIMKWAESGLSVKIELPLPQRKIQVSKASHRCF
jgi:hypothetical protein